MFHFRFFFLHSFLVLYFLDFSLSFAEVTLNATLEDITYDETCGDCKRY